MNIEIEKMFSEIGRLHIQVTLLTEQLAVAQAELEKYKSAHVIHESE
jgi:hypothetical protein